ncbi:hypothetical protein [Paenibacillus sp. SAFN-117]|uniref:hypothetical protein n=1 Tax=Paenibacillus sp. SAFN-117 TaxID=3436860 RepID=UPI003F81AC8E
MDNIKKRKWKKWLGWSAALLIVLAVGGYFAMDYAVDRMLRSISAGLELEAVSQPGGQDNSPDRTSDPATSDSKEGDKNVPVSGTPDPEDKGEAVPDPTSGPDSGGASDSDSGQPPSSGDKETKEEAAADKGKYQANITPDKASKAQEQITLQDKTKVTSVLLKRLGASDIKTLMDLASGGMSVEEKREAKKVILEKLSEEEYDELIAIAAKLGLSQGKSYEDSLKESSSKASK